MNDSPRDPNATDRDERKEEPRQAQPGHAADEKPARRQPGKSPVGTHSLTGGGAEVGMPTPQAGDEAERSAPRDEHGKAEPDPLAEPRANTGDLLGRKP